MKIAKFLFTLSVIVFLPITLLSENQLESQANVVISEVMPRPLNGDEWIEITNIGNAPVNIVGWVIVDRMNAIGVITPQNDFRIHPEQYIVIARDIETLRLLNLSTNINALIVTNLPRLNDNGDLLQLYSPIDGLIDEIEYPAEASRVAGRSWERVNLKTSGMLYDNWGPCADLSGNTAARENSLQPPTRNKEMSIELSQNPFDPTIAQLEISFLSPIKSGRLTVDIFDSMGRRMKRLVSNVPCGANSPTLLWDGKGNDNAILPLGRYIIHSEIIDLSEGKTYSSRRSVVIARNR